MNSGRKFTSPQAPWNEFSIASNPLPIDGPWTTLHDAPGLGIAVDWDLVARHRVDGV
jgi:L-alanine-DL-glutamate epimerase-like enolase superfamily enzyme